MNAAIQPKIRPPPNPSLYNPNAPPPCDAAAVFFDSEEMMFLVFLKCMWSLGSYFSQYFVISRPKMKPLVYETTGYCCTDHLCLA